MTLIEAIKSGAERIRRNGDEAHVLISYGNVLDEQSSSPDFPQFFEFRTEDILADDWEIEKIEWVGE